MHDFSADQEDLAVAEHGSRPDYGSGPYLSLMAAAVGLARRDLADPHLSAGAKSFIQEDLDGDHDEFVAGARDFLEGPLVELFAECLGFEGSFI